MNTLKRFWIDHPDLSSFILLALGMLIILFFSARHVGFSFLQWLVLASATVALAGLCIWIIGWDSGDESDTDTG